MTQINEDLFVLETSNSFGDQIIGVFDLNGNDPIKDKDFPFYSGRLVRKIVNHEGNHVSIKEILS
jgi:hypothetical protein